MKKEDHDIAEEFQRLGIALTDDFINVIGETAHRRFLIMQWSILNLYTSPQKYKLRYLDEYLDKYVPV